MLFVEKLVELGGDGRGRKLKTDADGLGKGRQEMEEIAKTRKQNHFAGDNIVCLSYSVK